MLLITLYREIVRQRLALYQGVCPVHMEFSDCAEKTFGDACSYLLVITDISYPLRFFLLASAKVATIWSFTTKSLNYPNTACTELKLVRLHCHVHDFWSVATENVLCFKTKTKITALLKTTNNCWIMVTNGKVLPSLGEFPGQCNIAYLPYVAVY
jgi:hypothetical protein